MHVHCLYWLMSTGLLLQSAFFRPCKSMTGEIIPLEGFNLAVGTSYRSNCQHTSIQALQWNIGPLWVHVDVIATLNSTNVSFASLFQPLPPSIPPSCPSRTPPYMHWPNINEFHEKIVKNQQKSAIIYLPGQLYKS